MSESPWTVKNMSLLFDHEKVMAAAIERYRAVMANREKLIEAWLAETGIPPSESMIVEQHMDNGDVRVSVQRRQPPDSDGAQKEIEQLKAELKEAYAMSQSLRNRMYKIGCQLQEERCG